MSGSTPVVSQSMRNAIVPVGASTVVWPLRKPYFSPSAMASSHDVARGLHEIVGHERGVDPLDGGAVLAHDLQERGLVLGVAGERPGRVGRDARRLVR